MPTLTDSLIDILHRTDSWITTSEIAGELHRSNSKLNDHDRATLDKLFIDGLIRKRLKPETGSRIVYEYRYLPYRRTRMQLIKAILCEFYQCQSVTKSDIAFALGEENLRSYNVKQLRKLVLNNEVAEMVDIPSNKFRCIDCIEDE